MTNAVDQSTKFLLPMQWRKYPFATAPLPEENGSVLNVTCIRHFCQKYQCQMVLVHKFKQI